MVTKFCLANYFLFLRQVWLPSNVYIISGIDFLAVAHYQTAKQCISVMVKIQHLISDSKKPSKAIDTDGNKKVTIHDTPITKKLARYCQW